MRLSQRVNQSAPMNIPSPYRKLRERHFQPTIFYGEYLNPYNYPYHNFHIDPRLDSLYGMGNRNHFGYDLHRARHSNYVERSSPKQDFVDDSDEPTCYRRRSGRRKVVHESRLWQNGFDYEKFQAKSPRNLAMKTIPLAKSLRKLYGRIEASEAFYRTFLSAYDNDVNRIKSYCPKSLLNSVWTFRVRGEKQKDEEQASLISFQR